MDGWLLNLTRVAAVTSGVMAGVFFAFSVAIMPALDRLAHPGGMKTMQTINDDIQNPLFLLVFLGSGVAGAALAVSAIWTWDQPGGGYRLAGGLLALIGIFVLTVVYHVPRNNSLDAVNADSAGAAAEWARYLREWVPWNHVRAVASTGSLVTLLFALSA
jgi:uncharacterized membrane protein